MGSSRRQRRAKQRDPARSRRIPTSGILPRADIASCVTVRKRPSSMSDTTAKNLNPFSIFAGFVPWIVFTFVAQRVTADGVAWSALLSTIISLVFIVHGRRLAGPTQIDIY